MLAALGNHESFPVNMFPTHTELGTAVSGDWLYSGIADLAWADWLQPEERDLFRWSDEAMMMVVMVVMMMLRRDGYYSTLARPGLRLVVLNTNFCHGENFFLFLDFSDPADQLAWLAATLLQSEAAGERVHILGHHPLTSCLPGWRREYGKIVNRSALTCSRRYHYH